MKVVISGKQMKLTPALKQYVEDHLVRQLTRFYDNQAAELRVEFEDSRPSRGGPDVTCHLTLHMPNARTIHVEESTPDAYASLDAGADRLIRAAHKEIDRMRDPGGHHTEHPLATTVSEGGIDARPIEELPNVLHE